MSTRPNPLQWLFYAFGGRVPAALREWAWHDLTDSDWQLRHVLRVVVQLAIPIAVVVLLPGGWSVRVPTMLLLLLGGVFVGVSYCNELRDRRLRQNGLPPAPRPEE
ncbi:MAG: DUF5313 family protein [Mycobacteriales bacterium]